MVSKLFGGGSQKVTTSGGGLPPFALEGLESALGSAQRFLRDPSIFEPTAITPEQQQALDVLSLGAEPLTAERFANQFDIFYNPYIEQTLDPALADLERTGFNVLGDIASGASQAGAFGSTRQAALEGELGRNLMQEAGRLSANVRSQAFDTATQNALNQLARQQSGAATLFDTGEILRSLEDQRKQAPVTAADFLARLASGIPVAGQPTTQKVSGGGPDIAQLASTAASLAGFFSDRRLKKDIEFLRSEKGHNIYRFRYTFNPQYYEGVMADEVEKINPEAVGEYEGYLTVDYDLLPVDLKEAA